MKAEHGRERAGQVRVHPKNDVTAREYEFVRWKGGGGRDDERAFRPELGGYLSSNLFILSRQLRGSRRRANERDQHCDGESRVPSHRVSLTGHGGPGSWRIAAAPTMRSRPPTPVSPIRTTEVGKWLPIPTMKSTLARITVT